MDHSKQTGEAGRHKMTGSNENKINVVVLLLCGWALDKSDS